METKKRPPEPEFVTQWRSAKAPSCCHTCELYDAQGYCQEFGMYPPADFAQQQDVCPKWIQEIPF